jgi:hypothetical protein
MNHLINSPQGVTKYMRFHSVLILVVVFVISMENIPTAQIASNSKPSNSMMPSQSAFPINRTWNANIVIVNYDENVINETLLLDGLPLQRIYTTDSAIITYSIEYSIYYANTTYADDLLQVMLENSINGTGNGSMLNESALSYQKAHPDEPQTIFYPNSGREIDGYAVEDWLEENPAIPQPQLGYTLYLLNYSLLDTSNHSIEHWYDYHPIDADTGQKQNWFRLEWDNSLNPNVSMDYSSFGGRYNTFIVDPSAHQWYLRWCRLWWSEYIGTEYDFWTKDLEDKVSTIDLNSSDGVDALSIYLRECIWDPITQLFFPYQHQPAKYVSSGLLRVLVFCMDVTDGISVDSLSWVTDPEMQMAHLEELYPFISWDVQVDFLDINQYPQWNTTFWTYSVLQPDGMTVVDGSAMFNAIYTVLRPQYIDIDDDNINVFGVVFIKKQMEMIFDGRTYTGLGGGGQTVIWKSWERYYRSDGITPKDGISTVQLHETMHAIGFAHTWQHEHYASDFSFGPMGYFAYHNGTSTFDRNWVQGTYLDQMEGQLWENFATEQTAVGVDARPETYLAEERAIESFSRAGEYYDQMNWRQAYDALANARDWTKRMKFSLVDDTPPEIIDWGLTQTYCGGFSAWADVTDDLSGLENVTVNIQLDNEPTVYRYPCIFNGSSWAVIVSSTNATHSFTAWIEAWDWGMNSVESLSNTWFIYPDTTAPPPIPYPGPYIFIEILIGACLVAVVLLVLVKIKNKQ